MARVIEQAYFNGAKFYSWSDQFHIEYYSDAIEKCGFDVNSVLDAKRYDEILPWDFVSVGVDKEYLIKESKKAKAVQTTPSCLKTCSGCGLIKEGLCNGCR